MSKGKSKNQNGGFLDSLFTKKDKGVTKQRGKSKDRYHQDPPEPFPGEYDSEEEISSGTQHQRQQLKEAKIKLKGIMKPPVSPSIQHREPQSNAKSSGRETNKKSTIQTLFGSSDEGKSDKKKSKDRYQQKNPYGKYEKGESKGGKEGERSKGGLGWFSGSSEGDTKSSGKLKVGKSKGHSKGRISKGESGGFNWPSI